MNESLTKCQCAAAGYCEALGRNMSAVRHHECQTQPGFFDVLLNTKGSSPPAPEPPEWHGDKPCHHLGDTLRTVKCKPCQGTTEATIRACALHKECAWKSGIRSKGMSGVPVQGCKLCDDYKPPEKPAPKCEHCGEVLRIVETKPHCPKCPPEAIPVLACLLHGECTPEAKGIRTTDGKKLLKTCDGCKDSTVGPAATLPQNPLSPAPQPKPAKPHPPKPAPKVTGFLRTGTGKPADCLGDLYHGSSVFLLLSGPSLAQMPLEQLNQVGVMVAACNNAATLYRPHLWFMVDDARNFSAPLWRDPAVMKFSLMDRAESVLRIHKDDGALKSLGIRANQCPNGYFISASSGFTVENFLDKLKPAWEGELHDGGRRHKKRSVMLIAVRMLYWLGFRTVYLLGADFHYRPEKTYAFPGCDKNAGMCGTNNTTMGVLNRWFQMLRPEFERRGFRIYNATPQSRLTAFEFLNFEEAIEQVAWRKPLETRGHYGS